MPFRVPPTFRFLLLALTLLGAVRASAQVLKPAPGERVALRVRYGLAFRSGAQESGPAVRYGGMTPNDVALGATVFGDGWWGAWASVQREGFSLSKDARLVTGGGLVRASVGPAVRAMLGPVRAELGVGYGYAQLPAFSHDDGQVTLMPTPRHAALVGARVRVPLPWREMHVEARGEVPVAIGSSSSGFSAGGAVLVPVVRRGGWSGALVLDYQYVSDSLTTADGLKSQQKVSRAGLAFELALGGRTARPGTGTLFVSVVDADSGEPLPGARVELTVGGVAQAPREVDAEGRLRDVELPRGEVFARVSVGGYLPVEESVTVMGGERAELVLRAQPEPRVGTLRVSVVDARSGQPLKGASVVVGAKELVTDAAGAVRVEGLDPGPLEVKIMAEGFRGTQEVVSIAAGTEADLPVSLAFGRQGALATLSGQVRSVRKGRPLQALLVIPEAKIRRRTDSRGSFQVQLKQGRYRLIFSAPGHLPQTKVVTVHDGEQAIFNVDLFPKNR